MDALFPAMLANAAVAVGLMAVAFGVAALRRPRAAHAAWLVVLAKLVTPPLVVVPVVWLAAEPTTDPAPIPIPINPVVPPPEATGEPVADPVDDGPAVDPMAGDAGTTDTQSPVPAVLVESIPSPETVSPWRVASVVWLAGAAGWCGLVGVRVFRFRRFVARALPADADTVDLARSVAARLGLRHVPAVAFVAGPVSPMLWAVVGRPRILLPRQLWNGFDPDHREAVLAHELAHLARGDHWVRRFELVVLALYWWCPVAWVAVRELRRAEEACCDARVLDAVPGRARAYAEALVETIAFVNRPGWVPLASGGAARASDLKRRVTMILNSTGGQRATPWLVAAVILGGLAVLPLAPGLADDPKPSPVVVPASADEPPPPAPTPPAVRWRVSDDRGERVWVTDPTPPVPAAPVAWSNWQANPNAFPAAYPSVNEAGKARMKDEFELLEAQMNVKQAHVRAAERGVKSAQSSLDRVKKAASTGTISQEEVGRAEEAYEKAISEMEIRKAEIQEHAVRMKQTQRKLSDAAPATATRPAANNTPWVGRDPGTSGRTTSSTPPAAVPGRASGSSRSATTPVPTADPVARPNPNSGFRPPAVEDRAGTRETIEKRMKEMIDQYERTQKDIEKMQKQQADIKRMLDDLAAEYRKRGEDLPATSRR